MVTYFEQLDSLIMDINTVFTNIIVERIEQDYVNDPVSNVDLAALYKTILISTIQRLIRISTEQEDKWIQECKRLGKFQKEYR